MYHQLLFDVKFHETLRISRYLLSKFSIVLYHVRLPKEYSGTQNHDGHPTKIGLSARISGTSRNNWDLKGTVSRDHGQDEPMEQ
jgi:hypothetical protein